MVKQMGNSRTVKNYKTRCGLNWLIWSACRVPSSRPRPFLKNGHVPAGARSLYVKGGLTTRWEVNDDRDYSAPDFT